MNEEMTYDVSEVFSEKVIKTIKAATLIKMDACWAILKYREYGIYRKALAIEGVLGLKQGDIADVLPTFKDEYKKGRIKDWEGRHLLNDLFFININEHRNNND